MRCGVTANVAQHLAVVLDEYGGCAGVVTLEDTIEIVAALRAAGIRADSDLRNEKISYKVREHSVAKVPVQFAVGQRELENRSVAIRRLGSKKQQVMALDEAIETLLGEIESRA